MDGKPINETRFTRSATFAVSEPNVEERTVVLSFASETPVERHFGFEVLEMSERSADLSRLNAGGALLSDHDHSRQIGKVEQAWIGDDKRAYAKVRFSKSTRGQEEFQDVIDGIRTNISFGYGYRKEDTEMNRDTRTMTVKRWEAFEISLVAVPADASVGVGRAQEDLGTQEIETPVELAKETENKRGSKMDKQDEAVVPAPNTFSRERQMKEYGQLFGQERMALEFAADPNKSFDDLVRAIGDKFKPQAETPQAQVPAPDVAKIGLSEKEAKRYSVSKAILAAADDNWKIAPFERECHVEIAKRLDRDPEAKRSSILVPSEFQTAKRDLSVSGGGADGAYLVSTDHMPGSFIELLRNEALMFRKGVTVLSGLVGNPSIPRQNGAATAYWLSEGTAPPESQQVFAQLQASPKTVGAKTDYTRQLLIQSAPSVDNLVMSDLAKVMALEIDRVIIDGDSSGSSGQPNGILNTTGVDTVAMAGSNFAFVDAVNFAKELKLDNYRSNNVSWLTNPTVEATLQVTPKLGSTFPVFLLENGRMNGYALDATNQVPASTIIFGDYSQVIVCEWGVLELEANRYGTGFAAGNIEVRALHMMDVIIRYTQALKKLEAFA